VLRHQRSQVFTGKAEKSGEDGALRRPVQIQTGLGPGMLSGTESFAQAWESFALIAFRALPGL